MDDVLTLLLIFILLVGVLIGFIIKEILDEYNW